MNIAGAAAQAWWDTTKDGIPDISFATSLPHNGDPGGFRKWLSERGIVYGLEYTSDLLSNVRGGTQTGTIYQGKVHAILAVDFEKLAGWHGLSFFTNVFEIHNTGRIRRDLVGGINTIAAIEAVPTIRLSEVWFEQKFFDGKASFRIGQLTSDSEFFYSDLSQMFLQSDWATITAVNLPSGGAAYPLSTPGVRLKYDPVHDVSLLLQVLNGDPAGPGPGDESELRNRFGLNFRLRDSPFIIGEAQLRTNMGKEDDGLARQIKFGGWTHTGKFDDPRFASDGTLLANPLGSGIPLQYRGNFGLYAVIDQQLYRPAGARPDGGIGVFSRVSISPPDRNLIDRYIDGGIVFAGLVPGRPGDRFGVSAMYSHFSDSVRAFDLDTISFTGIPGPVRDFEANLELTYLAEIVPGWTVQPVITRVWHPNGDASRNALVAGLRSLWRY